MTMLFTEDARCPLSNIPSPYLRWLNRLPDLRWQLRDAEQARDRMHGMSLRPDLKFARPIVERGCRARPTEREMRSGVMSGD